MQLVGISRATATDFRVYNILPPQWQVKTPKSTQKLSSSRKKNVVSIRHEGAVRTNLPTRETSDFVGKESIELKRYLRACPNPHLTWAGRDDVDGGDEIDVPVVPIFIHEKILPSAIIDNVRAEARRLGGARPQGGGI